MLFCLSPIIMNKTEKSPVKYSIHIFSPMKIIVSSKNCAHPLHQLKIPFNNFEDTVCSMLWLYSWLVHTVLSFPEQQMSSHYPLMFQIDKANSLQKGMTCLLLVYISTSFSEQVQLLHVQYVPIQGHSFFLVATLQIYYSTESLSSQCTTDNPMFIPLVLQ